MAQAKNLIGVSREIIAILSPETLVEQVVTLMYQTLGYEYVHLFLLEATGQRIILGGGLWQGQSADPGDVRVLRVG